MRQRILMLLGVAAVIIAVVVLLKLAPGQAPTANSGSAANSRASAARVAFTFAGSAGSCWGFAG